MLQNEIVKPIVKLRPYRTFLEVSQPDSNFLLRVKNGTDDRVEFGLFAADGGVWTLEAKSNIRKYIENYIDSEICNQSLKDHLHIIV